jgi:hypothetical protein
MNNPMCHQEDDCSYPECGLACKSDDDGMCYDPATCPQLRDGEPAKSGRSCPLLCKR